MKYLVIFLVVVLIINIPYSIYQTNKVNDLEADLTHLNKKIDTEVTERLNNKAKVVSDSLRVQYHRLNNQLIDSLINKENEKTIDSLRSLDSDGREQYLFSIEKRFGIR